MSEDIKKTFNEEVREKKRTANGVHGRCGRKAKKVSTPVDLLTGKERRAYEGTSPVTVSSIYDTIIPLEEFKSLPKSKKMVYLYEYRKRFPARVIAKEWNLSEKSIYYYYRSYLRANESTTENASRLASEPSKRNEESTVKPSSDANRECCFMMAGAYDSHTLSKKFSGLSHMLSDGLRYQVKIQIEEIAHRA